MIRGGHIACSAIVTLRAIWWLGALSRRVGPSFTASRHTWPGLSAEPFSCLLHAACSDIYRRARIGPDLQVIYRSIKPPSTNSSAPVV